MHLSGKSAQVRQQAIVLISRIAVVNKTYQEEKLMSGENDWTHRV